MSYLLYKWCLRLKLVPKPKVFTVGEDGETIQDCMKLADEFKPTWRRRVVIVVPAERPERKKSDE